MVNHHKIILDYSLRLKDEECEDGRIDLRLKNIAPKSESNRTESNKELFKSKLNLTGLVLPKLLGNTCEQFSGHWMKFINISKSNLSIRM